MSWLFDLLLAISAFALGMWTGDDIRKALRSRRARKEIESTPSIQSAIPLTSDPNRPMNNEYRDYEIDELWTVKKKLEQDYAEALHWPILRRKAVREMKQCLQMPDWHYDQNGTREFEAQRARTKAELADFDRKYAAALNGGQLG